MKIYSCVQLKQNFKDCQHFLANLAFINCEVMYFQRSSFRIHLKIIYIIYLQILIQFIAIISSIRRLVFP